MKQIPSNIRIVYDAHLEEKAISQRSRFYYKNVERDAVKFLCFAFRSYIPIEKMAFCRELKNLTAPPFLVLDHFTVLQLARNTP